MTPDILVEVEHLSRYYGGLRAVDDVSFTIRPGEILGFLGPNGAGKTTTMHILSGNLAPSSGRVRVGGHDLQAEPRAAKRLLGYLPEVPPLYRDLTVDEYLDYCAALEKELKDIHRETGKTFVYITHSLEEAMVMSDRISVMRAGRFVQVGTPQEIYSTPSSRFVSEFIGDVNVLAVKVLASGRLAADHVPGELTAPALPQGLKEGFLVVRPEFMRFLASRDEADNALLGRLYNEYALGSRIQYQVRVGDLVFVVEKLRHEAFQGRLDQEVLIGWDTANSVVVTDT